MHNHRKIVAERRARDEARRTEAEKVVPHGMYCYRATGPFEERVMHDGTSRLVLPTRVCPYLTVNPDKPDQQNGYCRFLRLGDWMEDGTWLLWDQVKECDVNTDGTVIISGEEIEIGTFDALPDADEDDQD